jgi:DNA polymerase III epsilon subunit-like protein
MPVVLCFDTETTGKPPPSTNPAFKTEGFFNDKRVKAELWPRIIQLAFIKYDVDSVMPIETYDEIIKMKPGVTIPPDSIKVHGITDKMSGASTIKIKDAMLKFVDAYTSCDFVVGHNIQFDINVVCAELTLLLRDGVSSSDKNKITTALRSLLYDKDKKVCTMQQSKKVCKLPKLVYDVDRDEYARNSMGHFIEDETLDKTGNRMTRNPRLETAHQILFKQKTNGQLHNALVDVAVCLRIFMFLNKKIDICDDDHKPANEFIYDTIRPSKVLSNQLPVQIGDSPRIVEIKKMHEIGFLRISKSQWRKKPASVSRRSRSRKTASLNRYRRNKTFRETKSL